MIIVTVHDQSVGSYSRPLTVFNKAEAIRSFVNEVQRSDPNNLLHTNRHDFVLYHIGDFADDTGELVVASRVVLVRGSDIADRAQPDVPA